MPEASIPEALVEVERAKKEAEAARLKAEAAKFDAERVKLEFEAEEARINVKAAEIHLDRERHKRSKELAEDEHHLFYAFTGSVEGGSVGKCIAQLTKWRRTIAHPEDNPIEIQFNSPGGAIVSGMALFDCIQGMRKAGFDITTSSIGYAASMAGILLQAGDKRVMGAESWLMIHEASFGTSGKIGEVEDTVEWVKMVQNRILDIFAERSNLSKRQLKTRWTRKDWWISSDKALEHGLIDEIR